MCGIVGFISEETFNNNILNSMVNTLNHRGPNDKGFKQFKLSNNKNIFLGHTRLSILDTSHQAHQPMIDERFILIFNGEIYNFIELRSELKALGYKFISTGDTEVVLKAFMEWGINAFKKFNGMWAIAIFDKLQNKLYLSRDRMGKKPLFYYQDKNKLIFASEIKAILKYPNLNIKPNYKKIYRYISTNYRYIDIDTETFFQDIKQVAKSTVIEINIDLVHLSETKYWELNKFDTYKQSEKDTIDEFRNLLVDSVKLRLRSDVPVGVFLSGGMDSTSIVSIASKVLKQPIMTFSGITGEKKGIYDESEYIDEVVQDSEVKHQYIKPDPTNIFHTVNEMLDFHDEPICTVTWYSLYLIVKNMKNAGVPVVLNGHGGDELLAGYWAHYQYNFVDLKDTNILQKEIDLWHQNHKRSLSEIEISSSRIQKIVSNKIREIDTFPNYSAVFKSTFKNEYNLNIEILTPKMNSLLSQKMYQELFFETVPVSLRAEDRNTMAHSIESRSPFLDHRLIEFSYALNNRYKIQNGLGKWILREAMKGILPEKVRTRKDKAGFIAPADEWFRTINKDQIFDMIKSKEFSDIGIFNVAEVLRIYQEHLDGNKNHQMFLWQLINLYLWFKKFY